MDQRSDKVISQHVQHVWAQVTWISKTLVTLEISITQPEHRTNFTSGPCHAMHILLVRLYIAYVKAMSSYHDLRNLVLQSAPRLQTLRVYVSEKEHLQSQWILSDVFQDFETNLKRKVRERGKLWLDSAKDLHKEVWPDRQVAEIKLSFKDTTEKAQQTKKDWKKDHAEKFEQNTVPTTIMVCLLFLLATNVKRVASAGELAVTMLRRVCRLVCEASHGITLDGISLDQTGKVLNASTLWPQDLAGTIQRNWDSDLLVQSNFWVQSSYEHPLLADCICFPFRPVLASSGRRAVREGQVLVNATKGIAFRLLRLLADALHRNITLVTISQGVKRKTVNEQDKIMGGQRKKIRVSRHELLVNISKIIDQLYTREAARLLHCDGTFFLFFLIIYSSILYNSKSFPGICICC